MIQADVFSGFGGASFGIEAATGAPIDVALNHDAVAIACHERNHPRALHLRADAWEVDPIEATGGRPLNLLWASPACTHFSRARGGRPKSKQSRSLAWVVVRWARDARPRMIFVENVIEFLTWGPIGRNGQPIAERAGETFVRWSKQLQRLGYAVDHRVLDASRYGAPTRRRRLFVVARRDGEPIEWPAPTHGPGLLPMRTAAECIDWSLPCPSIFERKRPLAAATMRRVAEGIKRFVLERHDPFVIELAGDAYKFSAPLVAPNMAHNVPRPASEPMPTVTSGNRNLLVAPTLVQTGHGERVGQVPRIADLQEPLGTIVAGGAKRALVESMLAPFVAHAYGGEIGREATAPLGVVTTSDHHQLVAANLVSYYGTGVGQSLREPLRTTTTKDRFALVESFLEAHGIPGPYTVRHAGGLYRIVDIGLRMLEPHELLAAQFGPYAKRCDLSGIPTKSAKIKLIGNSVCPQVAEALVRANLRTTRAARRQRSLWSQMP